MFPFCWPLSLFINDFKQMRKMTTYMDKHSPAVITTSITNYLFWKRLLTLLVQKQENTENPFVLLLLSELLLFIERTSLRNWIKEKNQSYRVVGEELHLGSVGEELRSILEVLKVLTLFYLPSFISGFSRVDCRKDEGPFWPYIMKFWAEINFCNEIK